MIRVAIVDDQIIEAYMKKKQKNIIDIIIDNINHWRK